MEEKETITSLISETLSFFKLDILLFLIIYPYKLPELTLYLNILFQTCESALNNGVKVTNIDVTPRVTAGEDFPKKFKHNWIP